MAHLQILVNDTVVLDREVSKVAVTQYMDGEITMDASFRVDGLVETITRANPEVRTHRPQPQPLSEIKKFMDEHRNRTRRFI